MSLQTTCPECEGPITLNAPMAGEIVPCPACGAELEVVSLSPLALSLAPETQEDLGSVSASLRVVPS